MHWRNECVVRKRRGEQMKGEKTDKPDVITHTESEKSRDCKIDVRSCTHLAIFLQNSRKLVIEVD